MPLYLLLNCMAANRCFSPDGRLVCWRYELAQHITLALPALVSEGWLITRFYKDLWGHTDYYLPGCAPTKDKR